MSRRWLVVGALVVLAPCRARAQCPAPGAPAITLYSNLPTAKGQTYVIGWTAASGLDAHGHYEVERSADAAFATFDSTSVTATSASLASDSLGTLHHRVRAVAACGTTGPASEAVDVTIVEGQPVVIFGRQPAASVRTQGDSTSSTSFEVWNIGGKPFSGYLSAIGTPFFSLSDSGLVLLAPGERKTFTAEFYGSISNAPGTVQGLLTIQSGSGEQPKAYPWALVNLTVEKKTSAAPGRKALAQDTAAPVFGTDFVSFKPTATDQDPPAQTISVTNPRSVPLALAAETGPDGWLVPQEGWNATPLSPGETRSFSIEARRLQGQADSAGVFPHYGFLTVRTKDGQSARVQFQDLDVSSGGPCSSRPHLADGQRSFLIPSVVTYERVDPSVPAGKVAFISRLLLTNASTSPVNAEIFFTPDRGGDTPADGFDCAQTLRSTVQIPGSDVLSLTDPLSKLFGFTPANAISGTLEIRSSGIGQIRADSVVDSPNGRGGLYGFQMPVVKSGAGATRNSDHFITGLQSDATYRSNLILAETSGKPATVLVSVSDASGNVLFHATKTLPGYSKVQINDGAIFGGRLASAAAVQLSVLDGAGSVVGLATVIDRVSQDASTFLGRSLGAGTASVRPGRKRLAGGLAYRWVVPTVVSGYDSKLGRGPSVFPYRSVVTIANVTAAPVSYQMTYLDGSGQRQSAVATLAARQTVSFSDVLKEAFGIDPAPGSGSTGSLDVDMDRPAAVITSRVYSRTNDGSFGDAIPVYPVSTSAAAGPNQVKLLADGFENSVDDSRGARTNLILTEIDGGPAKIQVRLFEKGKERSGAIAEKVYDLAPRQKFQVNKVFADMRADGKDRSNVLCEVTAVAGSQGRVVALGTRVDNSTADPKILVMTPIGENQGDPAVGF